jgi:vitamin B12 transporter
MKGASTFIYGSGAATGLLPLLWKRQIKKQIAGKRLFKYGTQYVAKENSTKTTIIKVFFNGKSDKVQLFCCFK